ncbi:MAG: peptide MFS transporter [Crocinitomicaceae bacterium]|nr:peptide MFS transporter [Crocinitomicaceae bacterium]
MQGNNSNNNFFETQVLGHPAGLFVLFFTEMWERFSYYGMRALLVLFLISSPGLGGWDWSIGEALSLYGTYTAMVYLTPILGGYVADRIIGYRKAVVIGALFMTLGHASMALESELFLYFGIGFLIIGNGFFKPNMTSIISHMYKDFPEKKDGAYTIFYMGVNAGAFLGIMLCGYIGESVSWSYGFGLAGIFMLLGMFQFMFAQKILGNVGLAPEKGSQGELENDNPSSDGLGEPVIEGKGDKFNPFTMLDKILMGVSAVIATVWIINDPLSSIAGIDLFNFQIGGLSGSNFSILFALALFIFLLISRILRYGSIVMDKMVVVAIFAFFTVFFWAAFEQAGGSMTIFANDFTDRTMSGTYSTIFIVLDVIITVVPIGIISWVLFKLFKKTFKKYALSNIILASSFLFIWVIVIWKINRNLDSTAYVAVFDNVKTTTINEETGEEEITYQAFSEGYELTEYDEVLRDTTTVIEPVELRLGATFEIVEKKRGGFKYINPDEVEAYRDRQIFKGLPSKIVTATVIEIKDNEVEIPATWFGILNSLFIIMFAPLFSRLWESKYNPSGPVKYGLGLILLGIGFGVLAMGSASIGSGDGTEVVLVSVWWLTFAYLFHTLGELCLSPVGLSYVSKLVPGRMIAFMFGVWYLAVAIGNKTAGLVGGQVEAIAEKYSISTFFLIFTLIPIGMGVLAILLSPIIRKLMHGVK